MPIQHAVRTAQQLLCGFHAHPVALVGGSQQQNASGGRAQPRGARPCETETHVSACRLCLLFCKHRARALGQRNSISVQTTLLGAHALPPEFAGRADDYVDFVCNEMLPTIAHGNLADAVDAFCDDIGFTRAQTQRIFEAAARHGLPVKLHAEQLSNQQGAALAAKFGALSADHLEYLDAAGVAAMANAGTVAVLLPGAYYVLRETRLPPIQLLRESAVAIAVASDLNPGTSPIVSLQANMHLACTLFRLTPTEVLRGVTVNAARALGLQQARGTLAIGQRADWCVWNVSTPTELCYWMGGVRPTRIVANGRERI